jgi:alpha-N-arabinofuranosidase
MGEYDREHRVKFAIDEWGAWHKAGSEVAPHHLFGQIGTMRDAIIAGLTLDIFHRHADKVAMTCVAQLVNCIHSLFIAHEEKMLRTPNYHVFDLYKDHQNGASVRAVFAAPMSAKVPRLDGSASLHEKEKRLVVTCTHADAAEPLAVELRIDGAAAKAARGFVLAGKPQDHNTFDEPRRVEPRALPVQASGGSLSFELPPCAVAAIHVDLA